MKRLINSLVVSLAVLILVPILVVAATVPSATVSIPNVNLNPGQSYSYSILISVSSAFACMGNISVTGVAQASETFSWDTSGTTNESTTITKKITVSIPQSAKPGQTFTISVTGQVSAYADGQVTERYFSQTRTLQVVKKPATPTPKPTPKPSEWELALKAIEAMDADDELQIDITENAQMPASLLAAIEAKQARITFKFKDYTCVIDGRNIGDTEGSDIIDLSLNREKIGDVSAACGQADLYQLHFAHKGEFPGLFEFSFRADQNVPGDKVYLYQYLGHAGVFAGDQTTVVDENGDVAFVLSEGSDYIVISDRIEGALRNFDDTEKIESALRASEEEVKKLEEQILAYEAEKSEGAPAVAVPAIAAEPQSKGIPAQVSLPTVALIAALLGTGLLAVFATLYVLKAGPFKKRSS
ncbi:MAG: hypothetical protein GX099_03270 [Clostridiaceae bacterium]|nr:hypothetical protein [Clostridiaceae bacterium]